MVPTDAHRGRRARLTANALLRVGRMESILDSLPAESLVEVGPGAGELSRRLARGRRYLGFEPDPVSHRRALEALSGHPSAVLLNETLPPTPTEKFDALVASEVLEHIEDDAAALASWKTWVRRGGVVLVTVPAKESRFGPWDEGVGHFRRYEREGLGRLFRDCQYQSVDVFSYGMPLGYLLEAIRNRVLAVRLDDATEMEARTARSGRLFQPRSAWLYEAATTPFRWLQKPFEGSNLGTGLIAAGYT